MAKRFIDTNIFRKSFIRSLPSSQKLLWIYLFCDCSHAGIWEVDLEVASLFTGCKLKIEDIKALSNKIKFFDHERKIFIPEFIEFQYGKLRSNNNTHIAVIRDLEKYNLINDSLEIINNECIEGLTSPLSAPCQPLYEGPIGAMDIDKDKDKEMDKDKKGGMGENKNESENFKKFKDWVKVNAPRVSKMKEPFTEKEFEALKNDFSTDFIQALIKCMHNHEPLLKKYRSANLTFRNWAKRQPADTHKQKGNITQQMLDKWKD